MFKEGCYCGWYLHLKVCFNRGNVFCINHEIGTSEDDLRSQGQTIGVVGRSSQTSRMICLNISGARRLWMKADYVTRDDTGMERYQS